MQPQLMHKVIQFTLKLGGRAIKDILANPLVDEASKVYASLSLQLCILSLRSGLVQELKSREVVQVFRFSCIVSGGLVNDST